MGTLDDDSCTAALIGRHTVLTAAHCVESGRVTFNLGGAAYESSTVHVHDGYDPRSLDNDVALVILSAPIDTVAPSPLRTAAVSTGQTIELVGVGWQSWDGDWDGHIHVGTNEISDVASTWFEYKGDSNNCSGDSGGPSFIGAEIAGVHSSGAGNEYCSHTGYDMRVDAYVDWITALAGEDLGGDDGVGGIGVDEPAVGTVEDDPSCIDALCDEQATDSTHEIAEPLLVRVHGVSGCEAQRAPGATGSLPLWLAGALLLQVRARRRGRRPIAQSPRSMTEPCRRETGPGSDTPGTAKT